MLKKFLVWAVPIIFIFCFLYSTNTEKQEIGHVIKYNSTTEEVFFSMSPNLSIGKKPTIDFASTDISKPQIVNREIDFFDPGILSLFQIPLDTAELEYCLSYSPIVINESNQEIETNDAIALQIYSGSITKTSSGVKILTGVPQFKGYRLQKYPEKMCSKYPLQGYISEFFIEHERIKSQAVDWGLTYENEPGIHYLYGKIYITNTVEPKHFSFFIIYPLAFTTVLWGILLLYGKVEKEFLYCEAENKKAKKNKKLWERIYYAFKKIK